MEGLLEKAGWVGYALIFLVLLTTALIFYKLYVFRAFSLKRKSALIKKLSARIAQEGDKWSALRQDEWLLLLDTELRVEKRDLEKYLSSLANISSIAPLLGLLGTILGMIHSTEGILRVDNTMLLRGISEALMTTAIGIVIAIPAILFYNSFLVKVEKILDEIKEAVLKKAV